MEIKMSLRNWQNWQNS